MFPRGCFQFPSARWLWALLPCETTRQASFAGELRGGGRGGGIANNRRPSFSQCQTFWHRSHFPFSSLSGRLFGKLCGRTTWTGSCGYFPPPLLRPLEAARRSISSSTDVCCGIFNLCERRLFSPSLRNPHFPAHTRCANSCFLPKCLLAPGCQCVEARLGVFSTMLL